MVVDAQPQLPRTVKMEKLRVDQRAGPLIPAGHVKGDPFTEGLNELIRSIRWARLRLTLLAQEPLHLPPYKGSTFRGAFGHAFKRVACPLRRECAECAHQSVCVYAYVFETPAPTEASSLARGPQVAHPFVLEPPETDRREFASGDRLEAGLVLIGRAIPLAPYFLAACREMGRQGVGRGRGRFRLERVIAQDPEDPKGRVVYDGAEDLLAPAVPFWSGEDLASRPTTDAERITLDFLTPTRLRQDADLVVRPDFATLATALLRRLSVLAEVHCGRRPGINARGLLAGAAEVKVVDSQLRWHDWERYSARQQTRMALGGFVGGITFSGPLASWLPLLRLGEVVHVGKGTSFGLGKYRIEYGIKTDGMTG
jgi:CRISPR-associated endoribonuclease Cas6